MSSSCLLFVFSILAVVFIASCTEQYSDDDMGLEKRSLRNAMVRFGRSNMRNALVRFGKRSELPPDYGLEAKRSNAPEPLIRFGRSSGRPTESLHDLIDTWQKLEMAYNDRINA
ncbi:hypothetical protein M3Y94_00438700 [Aphelenchoides besseyi]|nr:hypothetical protein M3Y94_00438700 [Aphelenchoides besseyi]KAI6229416.1 Neuropeptide AFP-6 [Aphelenchoides besseyi]